MASKWPDLSEDEESEEDVPVDVQIIRKNTKFITGRINAVDLLDYFKPNFFTEEEREEIKCDCSKGQTPTRGARSLLDRLIRKRDGWFDDFLEALDDQYSDIVELLRKDRENFLNENNEIYFQEPPAVTRGDLAEPFKPMSTIDSQEKTISSDDDRIDLSKKKSVNRRNIAMDNLREKQTNKNIDVFPKISSKIPPGKKQISLPPCVCGDTSLASDETEISSDFTRVLNLDEEQTCAKQLWTEGADVTVPSFCSPGGHQYSQLQSPTSPRLNNISYVPTNEKKIMVGLEANDIGTTYARKKDNRLKVSSFEPRKYQLELAERPKEGKNAIICSPTNSGKTYVAIMVTKHHLYENQFEPTESCPAKRQDPKVIVVVPRFALLQQVCRDFRSHLPLYHIGTRSGGSPSKTSLRALAYANDIIIVTADILKNALRDNTKLSDFTLLILDECHYTMKDHSYNDIMENYVLEKLSASPSSLPQVLALTASPGAGKIPDVLSARQSILRLCANLDADCFVTVKNNVDDLSRWVSTPDRQRIRTGKRTRDPFTKILAEWMDRLESRFELKNICEKSTQEYESFIVEKRKDMLLDRNFQGTRVCDHLISLNNALILADNVRMVDGVNLVRRFYEQLELETRTLNDTETLLYSFYKANKEGLLKVAALENRYPNPKLDELRHEILSHKDTCSIYDVKLRVMVFVKTKEITQAMLEWMKDDEKLKEFNPSPFTGVRADVEKGGMSKQKQKDVLYAFEKGDHQILISTSAGEEGIDIPECSRIIRYNHVTNEISMIQSRGRVRQKEGREVILGESVILEKDLRNIQLEEVMVEAMGKVTAMSPEELRALTGQIQRAALEERQEKIDKKTRLKNLNQADSVKLYCKGCNMFVCMASDIRKYLESNHILVDKKFKELINVTDHPDEEKAVKYNMKKIACKNCGQDWGVTARGYPCLKICSFFSEIDGQMKSFKKWKQVPYKIIDF